MKIIKRIFTAARISVPSLIVIYLSIFMAGCNIGGAFNGLDGFSSSYGGGYTIRAQGMAVSSTEVDFGSVTCGTGLSQSIDISNRGTEELVLKDVFLENSSDFSIGSLTSIATSGESPITIPPDGDIKVELKFIPTTTGNISTILHISSNDPYSSEVDIYLWGNSVPEPVPDLAVSIPDYNFGEIVTGEISSYVEIIISNPGAAPLNIFDLRLLDTTNFTLDLNGGSDPCGSTTFSLPQGKSCTISLAFGPFISGPVNTELEIDSDDPDNQALSIELSGKGTLALPPTYRATLSWQPPTTNADGTPLGDLSGYIIYFGKTSGTYTDHVDVGNVTSYTLENLSAGKWHFAVTAYDTSGNESTYSNEAIKSF